MLDDAERTSRPITRNEAMKRAKYLLIQTYGEPENSWARKETRDLGHELMTRAVADALKNQEETEAFAEKLAYYIQQWKA